MHYKKHLLVTSIQKKTLVSGSNMHSKEILVSNMHTKETLVSNMKIEKETPAFKIKYFFVACVQRKNV